MWPFPSSPRSTTLQFCTTWSRPSWPARYLTVPPSLLTTPTPRTNQGPWYRKNARTRPSSYSKSDWLSAYTRVLVILDWENYFLTVNLIGCSNIKELVIWIEETFLTMNLIGYRSTIVLFDWLKSHYLETAYSCDLHVMRNDRFHLSPKFFFYRFKRCPLRFIMCMCLMEEILLMYI